MNEPTVEVRIQTTHEAFQTLCEAIDSQAQHGVGTNPSLLATAIDELIDAKLREQKPMRIIHYPAAPPADGLDSPITMPVYGDSPNEPLNPCEVST